MDVDPAYEFNAPRFFDFEASSSSEDRADEVFGLQVVGDAGRTLPLEPPAASPVADVENRKAAFGCYDEARNPFLRARGSALPDRQARSRRPWRLDVGLMPAVATSASAAGPHLLPAPRRVLCPSANAASGRSLVQAAAKVAASNAADSLDPGWRPALRSLQPTAADVSMALAAQADVSGSAGLRWVTNTLDSCLKTRLRRKPLACRKEDLAHTDENRPPTAAGPADKCRRVGQAGIKSPEVLRLLDCKPSSKLAACVPLRTAYHATLPPATHLRAAILSGAAALSSTTPAVAVNDVVGAPKDTLRLNHSAERAVSSHVAARPCAKNVVASAVGGSQPTVPAPVTAASAATAATTSAAVLDKQGAAKSVLQKPALGLAPLFNHSATARDPKQKRTASVRPVSEKPSKLARVPQPADDGGKENVLQACKLQSDANAMVRKVHGSSTTGFRPKANQQKTQCALLAFSSSMRCETATQQASKNKKHVTQKVAVPSAGPNSRRTFVAERQPMLRPAVAAARHPSTAAAAAASTAVPVEDHQRVGHVPGRIRHYKPLMIKPSTKPLTKPASPHFSSRHVKKKSAAS